MKATYIYLCYLFQNKSNDEIPRLVLKIVLSGYNNVKNYVLKDTNRCLSESSLIEKLNDCGKSRRSLT